MKKAFSIFLVSSLFLISSCAYKVKTSYEYSLQDVDNPDKKQFKETVSFLVNSETEKESPFVFEDKFIKIHWTPTIKEFNFKLNNKTDSTINKLIFFDKKVYDYGTREAFG